VSQEFGDRVEGAIGKAVEAYGKAIALDSAEPRYFVGRGYAACQLAKPSWDAVEADARGAKRANGDRDFYGSLGLQAYVDLMRARQEADPAKRAKELRAAVARYERAVNELTGLLAAKTSEDGLQLPALRTGRSTACVELANAVTDETTRRDLLARAKGDAQAVLNGDASEREKAYARCALGNALEDFAWLLGEKPDANYGQAADAFAAARRKFDLPYFQLQHGRVLYKWAEYGVEGGQAEGERLGKAREAITILRGARESPDPALKAEALHWLGQAHALRGEYDSADSALKGAVDVARELKLPSLGIYQVSWAELPLRRVRALKRIDPTDSAVTALLAEARKRAALIAADRPLDADFIDGESFWLVENWGEALKAYESHSWDPAGATQPVQVRLLTRRVFCRNSLARPTESLESLQQLQKSAEWAVEFAEKLSLASAIKVDAYVAAAELAGRMADAAGGSGKATAQRLEAIAKYKKAAECAPADPKCWERYASAAGQYIRLLAEASGKDYADYYKGAREQLDKAARCPGARKEDLELYEKYLRTVPRPK
jgi:hypothetical protein